MSQKWSAWHRILIRTADVRPATTLAFLAQFSLRCACGVRHSARCLRGGYAAHGSDHPRARGDIAPSNAQRTDLIGGRSFRLRPPTPRRERLPQRRRIDKPQERNKLRARDQITSPITSTGMNTPECMHTIAASSWSPGNPAANPNPGMHQSHRPTSGP